MWPTATEYMEAIKNPKVCFRVPDLQEGIPAVDRLGMPFVSSGQFAYVFKLNHSSARASAIRCFRGFLGDREIRYKAIAEHLNSVSLPALAHFDYDAEGILLTAKRYPILVMGWIEGATLDVYLEAALQNSSVILHLADEWLRLTKSLENARVAHGDLQHGNIIVQNGSLRLVDLDGMFVPSMSSMKSCELGHRHYQHPQRNESFFNSELDNFSSLVIYLSLIAVGKEPSLWKKFHDENLIFIRSDYLNPAASVAFSEVRKIGPEERRLTDILEKACLSVPSMTPRLSTLVQPKSKLPAWMVASPNVLISTKTREVKNSSSVSGTPSPFSQSSPQNTAAVGASAYPPSVATPQQPTTHQPASPGTQFGHRSPIATKIDWSRVRDATVSNSVTFGLMGLLFVWAWFPLLTGIYNDLGFQPNSETLAVSTYLLLCITVGFIRAVRKSRISSTYATPVVYVPATVTVPPVVSIRVPTPNPSVPQMGRRTSRYKRSATSAITSTWSSSAGSLVGSRARLIYHRPTCEWARKIAPRNSVSFSSVANAQAAGYRRCNVCLP